MSKRQLIDVLKEDRGYSPVVPFRPGETTLVHLDLSSGNPALSQDILSDTKRFTAYIQQLIASSRATYAIGGYAELRSIYELSPVFDAKVPGEEPRRFHLGVDIWGKAYTKVLAPLDGIVHSFAFNNNFGDYGATIILAHHLDDLNFYTLYGHLSLSSIRDKQEGQAIGKGDVFAEFGIPIENGHWPPHLHFQVIREIGENKGDYPGVCKYSEREKFLENCPDPDLVLQINKHAV